MKNSATETLASPLSSAFYAAVTALLLWSGTAIANKIAVGYMDGLTAGVLRSLLAGVFAMIIALAMQLPFPASTRDRLLLAASGVSSFAAWPILLSVGIVRTTAGHAALIMAMVPVFTVFIATVIQRRLPGAGWWLGAVIALTATTMLILSRGILLKMFDDGSSITGDLIILAGGLICAMGYVAGGKLSPRIGTVATTFWGLSIALVILVPVFGVIAGHTAWTAVPQQAWLAIAWMTLLSSLGGYALWFYALGRGGISRIGSLQLMMPVLTLAAAALMLGETLTLFLAATCSAIIFGTYLAHRYATE